MKDRGKEGRKDRRTHLTQHNVPWTMYECGENLMVQKLKTGPQLRVTYYERCMNARKSLKQSEIKEYKTRNSAKSTELNKKTENLKTEMEKCMVCYIFFFFFFYGNANSSRL